MRKAYIYFADNPESRVEFVVRDLWVDFADGHDSVAIRGWERADQALQRVFPGCRICIGGVWINPPGMREWEA